ncbi:MAG: hypothetical protein AAGA88_00830 [Pseudomonadota bacterium]
MRKKLFGLFGLTLSLTLGLSTHKAHAVTITESWLSQAGISCGGGSSETVKGELQAALIQRLRVVSGETEGSYTREDVENLLNQFGSDEKFAVLKNHTECILTLADIATRNSDLPPRDVKLVSPFVSAPLTVVRRGDEFPLKAGDTVAVGDKSLIFTLNSVSKKGESPAYIYFAWSNSETLASQSNTYVYQAQPIKLGEQCVLVPFLINADAAQASFISNC